MERNDSVHAFFELLKSGLWEKDVRLSRFGDIDYDRVCRLAEEQSVVGLVAAGLEHVVDLKVPKRTALKIAGTTLQLERRNAAMNSFVAELVELLKSTDNINPVLVKGQGIAQCYERPLWRTCGDVDFLLNEADYIKSKEALLPLAASVEAEARQVKHLAMCIDSWTVELHGSLKSGLLPGMDRVTDEVVDDIFRCGNVRSWHNGSVMVSLPAPDNDVFLVFTHILKHFFRGGIGLRQICDWCRLLWTYRGTLDITLLESRLESAAVMTEWKAFAAFAVAFLGMPAESIPLYSPGRKWSRKAERALAHILTVGNFGHNRENVYKDPSYVRRKMKAFGYRVSDALNHLAIFPLDSAKVFARTLVFGLMAFVKSFLSLHDNHERSQDKQSLQYEDF